MNTTWKTCLAVAALLAMTSAARADLDTFESFTTGQSVNGQGEWTVEDSFGNSAELFDEEIADDGTGNNVWRISDSYTNTSYSNQPFSSKPDQIAGETGAQLYNDYGTDHTHPNTPPLSTGTATSKFFYGAWDFKSATDGAQPGLSISISPSASQSTLRMSYLNITDSGSGFDLTFYDTDDQNFNGTTVATGLSYDDWHHVALLMNLVDGIGPANAGNDVVKVFVDGSLAHTGTSWESYFYTVSEGGFTAPTTRAVDSLLFRSAGTAHPGDDGAGFYFDNVETSNVPEPASLVLVGMGLVAGGIVLRRRRG